MNPAKKNKAAFFLLQKPFYIHNTPIQGRRRIFLKKRVIYRLRPSKRWKAYFKQYKASGFYLYFVFISLQRKDEVKTP